MANTERGEVDVRALDRDFILRFGVNELIDLQDAMGDPDETTEEFLRGLGQKARRKNLKTLRTIVWKGLKPKDGGPPVTEELAGRIIDDLGIAGIFDIVAQGLVLQAPESRPEKEGKAPSPGPGS